MQSSTIKNLLITSVVVIFMTIASMSNTLITLSSSALTQWKFVHQSFLSHAQLISRLPRLVSISSNNLQMQSLTELRYVYSKLSDHEEQILFITNNLILIDQLLSDKSIYSQISPDSPFIRTYTQFSIPKLQRSADDYNAHVALYNRTLSKFGFRFLSKLSGLYALPYISIGGDQPSINLGINENQELNV